MEIEPIGVVRTCFGDKFAVPRQAGLCPDAWGTLAFAPRYRSREAVRGLEGFSHLWITFHFHAVAGGGWQPTVRPPRLGGNRRIGVFASRSPFRPNGLGLSLARLEGIDLDAAEAPLLRLGGTDLVDGTPVLDVKPYLPWCDAVAEARAGFAAEAPAQLAVEVAPGVAASFAALPGRARAVIRQALALDPRPAVQAGDPARVFGALLCGHEVRFTVGAGVCRVVALTPMPAGAGSAGPEEG